VNEQEEQDKAILADAAAELADGREPTRSEDPPVAGEAARLAEGAGVEHRPPVRQHNQLIAVHWRPRSAPESTGCSERAQASGAGKSMTGLTGAQRRVLGVVGWSGQWFDTANDRYDALIFEEPGAAPPFAKVVQSLIAEGLIRLSLRDHRGGTRVDHLWLTDAGTARLSEHPPRATEKLPWGRRRRGR
jgi:hypothetical protein